MFQQGDVLIQETDERRGKKLNHRILAKGEATGHAHRVSEGDVTLYQQKGILFLRVNSNVATVVHEEHLPLVIPQGDYKISRVREYDHFAEEVREVTD